MTATAGSDGRPATISDVALLAGVSVPTVSRVLTGSAKVTPGKREQVERAIAHLGFRPNPAARQLSSRAAGAIGVVTADTSIHGYAETIRGIEEEARAKGTAILITVVESAQDERVEQAVEAVLSHPLDGVIALKFDPAGVAALRRLPGSLPVVALAGARDPSRSQVLLAEREAGRALTAMLLDLGHRTVHHVRIPSSSRNSGRAAGWRRALQDAGRVVPPPLDTGWDPRDAVRLGRLMALDDEVTAVFCGNDEIAMGVMRGLIDGGRRVPDDVSVVGFDDHPLAALWTPALTTARQDFAALGRLGVRLLREQLEGGGRVCRTLAPRLVRRGSTAAPRVDTSRITGLG